MCSANILGCCVSMGGLASSLSWRAHVTTLLVTSDGVSPVHSLPVPDFVLRVQMDAANAGIMGYYMIPVSDFTQGHIILRGEHPSIPDEPNLLGNEFQHMAPPTVVKRD